MVNPHGVMVGRVVVTWGHIKSWSWFEIFKIVDQHTNLYYPQFADKKYIFKFLWDFFWCTAVLIRTCATVKIATWQFIFSYSFLVFVAQYGNLLVLSTCLFKTIVFSIFQKCENTDRHRPNCKMETGPYKNIWACKKQH